MFSLNERLGIKPKKKETDPNIVNLDRANDLTVGLPSTVKPDFFGDLTKLYKDPYSGEFYGEADRTGLLTGFENQLRSLDDNINNYSSRKPTTFRPLGKGSEGTSLEALKKTRESIQKSFDEFKNTKYNQTEKFFKSFDAYKPDWLNYFEGNYKNARLAEENDNITARQEQSALSNVKLSIPTQSLARGNLNTGLGITGGSGGLGV